MTTAIVQISCYPKPLVLQGVSSHYGALEEALEQFEVRYGRSYGETAIAQVKFKGEYRDYRVEEGFWVRDHTLLD